MCIAYVAFSPKGEWPLFIAANRDEVHLRPTAAARPWTHNPDIIAGLDLESQGTWLGITRHGRIALITNYRDPLHSVPQARSRGLLTREFLEGRLDPHTYMHSVARTAGNYNGFNLIVSDLEHMYYYSNRGPQGSGPELLTQGRYVLSNHFLDTPWPKAQRLRTALDALDKDQAMLRPDAVFDILRDTTQAQDNELPSTGLSLERERLLSSPFIISDTYGTRCSTVIAVHRDGDVLFSEQSYGPDARATERHDWRWKRVSIVVR